MKVSQAIAELMEIQKLFGDISITGGCLSDDRPLKEITVTDSKGLEIYPEDPNGVAGENTIDGVFLS